MVEIEGWVARDEDGELYLYLRKPKKVAGQWLTREFQLGFKLDGESFPEVKWSDDEPTKVKITIEKLHGKDKGNTTKCANANMEID